MSRGYSWRIRKVKKIGDGTYVTESYSPGFYLIATIFSSIFKAIWALICNLFKLCAFVITKIVIFVCAVFLYLKRKIISIKYKANDS